MHCVLLHAAAACAQLRSGRGEDWEAELEHIRAVAEAGADWWIEWVPPGDREVMLEAVERGPLRLD